MKPQKRHTVIIGGGVIGCNTAYFLTRHAKFDRATHRITLLEACSAVAPGASGKAGGLLAIWAHPEPLVKLSYRLHAELAGEHDGAARWGYRELTCGAIEAKVSSAAADERKKRRALVAEAEAAEAASSSWPNAAQAYNRTAMEEEETNQNGNGNDQETGKDWAKLPKLDAAATRLFAESPIPKDLDYIDPACVLSWSEMGMTPSDAATAQVHPLHFTNAIADLAREAGAVIRTDAQVTRIASTSAGVQSVEYRDRNTDEALVISDATDVVVAAGPWTGVLLPRSKVTGLRAHSVVYKADVSPHAVFTSIRLPSNYVPAHRQKLGQNKRKHGGVVDPEIYARPFGEVYACGETDQTPLPETADKAAYDEESCDDIIAYVDSVSPLLASAPVSVKQACYLPTHTRFARESGPLIGRTTTPNLWVASGHSCWGIQNSPATGKLMSELLLDGAATSVNIDKFDPRKFKV